MKPGSVLVLGAGPTRLGAGNELDHGRITATRALARAGWRVALLDSSPAVMPASGAHATYLEPLEARSVLQALEREGSTLIAPVWGGDAARDVMIELGVSGELARQSISILGATRECVEGCARAGELERFAEERGDRVFTSLEVELLLEPKRAPIAIGWITGFEDPSVHPKDAVGRLGAPSPAIRALVVDHVAALAARLGCNAGAFYAHVAFDAKNRELYVLSCAPAPTRVSALVENTTRYPFTEHLVRVLLGGSLSDEERNLPTPHGIAARWPRFSFDTFERADSRLSNVSASLGETLGVGDSLAAALQIAARTGEAALDGLVLPPALAGRALSEPRAERLLLVAQALREGKSEETLARATGLDTAVVSALGEIVLAERRASASALGAEAWRGLKRLGFSDARVAALSHREEATVRAEREACGVARPRFVRCAAGSNALWPSWNEEIASDADRAFEAPLPGAVLLCGGGPVRIGYGPSCDSSALSALRAARDAGHAIVVTSANASGPLAGSPDAYCTYLVSPSAEDIGHVTFHAAPAEAVFSHGGAEVRRLASNAAARANAIASVVASGACARPENALVQGAEAALGRAIDMGYPLIVRTWGERGAPWSAVVHDSEALTTVLRTRGERAVRLEPFIANATEVDVVTIADGSRAFIVACAEHVEPAGIHEFDSAKVIPPYALGEEVTRTLEDIARTLALTAGARGLSCARFAWDGRTPWLLHWEHEAPEILPLVSCLLGRDHAGIAMRCVLGASLEAAGLSHEESTPRRVAVRECMLPFRRLIDVDPTLRPDAQSTGHVAGVATTVGRAYAKALRAMGLTLQVPHEGHSRRVAFFATSEKDASAAVDIARRLHALGFDLAATEASAAMFTSMRIPHRLVPLSEPAAASNEIERRACVAIVTAQTPEDIARTEGLRHASRMAAIPCFTTITLARAACSALEEEGLALEVAPLERSG